MPDGVNAYQLASRAETEQAESFPRSNPDQTRLKPASPQYGSVKSCSSLARACQSDLPDVGVFPQLGLNPSHFLLGVMHHKFTTSIVWIPSQLGSIERSHASSCITCSTMSKTITIGMHKMSVSQLHLYT